MQDANETASGEIKYLIYKPKQLDLIGNGQSLWWWSITFSLSKSILERLDTTYVGLHKTLMLEACTWNSSNKYYKEMWCQSHK